MVYKAFSLCILSAILIFNATQCMFHASRALALRARPEVLSTTQMSRITVFYKAKPTGSLRTFAVKNSSPNQALKIVQNLIKKNENSNKIQKLLRVKKFDKHEIESLLNISKEVCAQHANYNQKFLNWSRENLAMIVSAAVGGKTILYFANSWINSYPHEISTFMGATPAAFIGAGALVAASVGATGMLMYIPDCIKVLQKKHKHENATKVLTELEKARDQYDDVD